MNSSAIETRLRVATWNLWWQFGPWQDRAPAIIATLKEIDADIIALQEVWDDGDNNFAAQLAAELGYHHIYAPGARPNGIHLGNAILSRWPISKHEIIALYDDPKAPELRVAIHTEIDGPRGKLPVFCTHLNWRQQDSHIRQKQVAELAKFIDDKGTGKYPPILCGDFNADPQAKEIRMLTGQTSVPVKNLVFHDAWSFVHPTEPGFTWDNANPHVLDGFEPNRRIDYIFTGWARGQGLGHIVDCEIKGTGPINGTWPSDHYAVVAELRY
ncbi:MAG: endonuclease/exonuclease/phosphatase family protein [Paracoccaceae bacterium]